MLVQCIYHGHILCQVYIYFQYFFVAKFKNEMYYQNRMCAIVHAV